ncbi:MAG: hypothetical protein ACRD8O_07795, partial [Bryobacteraceae bacterium]
AEVANARMILAETDHRRPEAVAQAGKAAGRVEELLALGALSEVETPRAAQVLYNVALAHKNMHLFDDSARHARRAAGIARPAPSAQKYVGLASSLIADLQRISGDLEGALKTIRDARRTLEKADFASEPDRRSSLFGPLWREGCILGEYDDINLGRPGEAIAALQKASDLTDELARKDPDDARSRILVATANRELGAILCEREPKRALAVYDHALLRLGEIKNNSKARREEVTVLAGSSYALRRLNRPLEAQERIDAAFVRLRNAKDYPAQRVAPGSEVDHAVRALADHLAETGNPQRAAESYAQLLDQIVASQPDPQNDLRHAVKLSGIHAALARLHRRNQRPDLAQASSTQRIELWRHWDRRLPNNKFVRLQLESARIH